MILIFFACFIVLLPGTIGEVQIRGFIWDEDCLLHNDTERIQVAFALDCTKANKQAVWRMKNEVQGYMNQLNKIHPNTEFALTTHANWPQSAFTRAHEEPDSCYWRCHNFSTNVVSIMAAFERITLLTAPTSSPEQNSVAGLAFTASDELLGWIPDIHDAGGKRVHRFMVLVTPAWSIFDLPNPGDRQPFRGDGSDTCDTSLPPSLEKLRTILEEKDVYVIGMYFTHQATVDKYAVEFHQAGFGHRHCYRQEAFTSDNFQISGSKMIIGCVKGFLRCVYLDPPGGYNTLGL